MGANPINADKGVTITSQEALDALPEGSVIQCEVAEYDGVYNLTNADPCCTGWHTFEVFDGDVEVVDDFTPVLPARVIS
jgi:hypothetical protein